MPKQTKKTDQQSLLDQIAELRQQIVELQNKKTPTFARREPGQPRPGTYYKLLGVPSKGFRPQAMLCARILATATNSEHIPEAEAMALIESAKQLGRLKTVQPSWRVFAYYRAELIAGKYLQMLEETA